MTAVFVHKSIYVILSYIITTPMCLPLRTLETNTADSLWIGIEQKKHTIFVEVILFIAENNTLIQ